MHKYDKFIIKNMCMQNQNFYKQIVNYMFTDMYSL